MYNVCVGVGVWVDWWTVETFAWTSSILTGIYLCIIYIYVCVCAMSVCVCLCEWVGGIKVHAPTHTHSTHTPPPPPQNKTTKHTTQPAAPGVFDQTTISHSHTDTHTHIDI
jgi:hypothetical protein